MIHSVKPSTPPDPQGGPGEKAAREIRNLLLLAAVSGIIAAALALSLLSDVMAQRGDEVAAWVQGMFTET